MKIYMEISQDGLELPVAVADTAAELAKMSGTSAEVVRSSISKVRRGIHKKSRFIEIEINESEAMDE
jgi:hypothetical protein